MNFDHFCIKLYVQVAELYERLGFLLLPACTFSAVLLILLDTWPFKTMSLNKTAGCQKPLAHSCEWFQWVWSSFNSSVKGQPEGTGWELQGHLGGGKEFKTNLTLLNYKRSYMVGFTIKSLWNLAHHRWFLKVPTHEKCYEEWRCCTYACWYNV